MVVFSWYIGIGAPRILMCPDVIRWYIEVRGVNLTILVVKLLMYFTMYPATSTPLVHRNRYTENYLCDPKNGRSVRRQAKLPTANHGCDPLVHRSRRTDKTILRHIKTQLRQRGAKRPVPPEHFGEKKTYDRGYWFQWEHMNT